MKYAILIEKGERNYSAYVPDVTGCVATGDTVEEVTRLIQEAIAFHFEGLLLDGAEIPEACTLAATVEVDMGRVTAQAEKERTRTAST